MGSLRKREGKTKAPKQKAGRRRALQPVPGPRAGCGGGRPLVVSRSTGSPAPPAAQSLRLLWCGLPAGGPGAAAADLDPGLGASWWSSAEG